ncbi:MAG: DUF6279 family lipoprotein [Luminiphilus sp.]|jgi:hypothetical protein|nr:DUF6279 family lipoprotein [Luminiphilus sp.]
MPGHRGSFLRLLVTLLASTLVLAACSANRFLYNRADTFVRWAIDDYVDLTVEQQKQFDADLEGLLDWHRRDELPIYREFIVSSLDALEGGVTIDEAVSISDSIDEAANRLQVQLIDFLLMSAEGLSDSQIQTFLDELDLQQEEYSQERLTRDDIQYADDAADSLQRLAKRLLGRLNDDQKALVQSRSTELIRIDRLWHEDRSVWGAKLRTILESRSPGWQTEIRVLGDTRSEARTPAYVAGIEHNGDVILRLLVDTINDRTERQDRRMRRFLDDLIADIDALTAANVAEGLVVQ